ncbi:MAG: glycosyltransferase family 39 protein [Cyanobacteria bacterium P01_F01_bin.150]
MISSQSSDSNADALHPKSLDKEGQYRPNQLSVWRTVWLRNVLILLLVFGVFFRFYHIDHKVYWYDETMTSLRISGYTQPQFEDTVYGKKRLKIGELRDQYQYPTNGSTTDDMWTALAQHPEHSPAYYALTRVWMQLWPNQVLSIRLLSVLISLLAFPCIYWLTWELFGSHLVSWMATATLAISPFHILYAQEAREYSLWTVTILLSSATLLWANRRPSAQRWLVYSLTNTLGLYVHPFSAFVSVSHGLYIFITERFRLSRRSLCFAMAMVLSLILLTPWVALVWNQADLFVSNTASVTQPRSGFLPLFWLLNLSRLFFDFNQGPSAINPVHYILAGLLMLSVWRLYQKASLNSFGFVILLMGVTGLALLGPDILLGGRRSSITRYAIPAYLGIQISMAFLFASQVSRNPLAAPGAFRWSKKWRNGAIALALAGVLSCMVSSQYPVWWHKSYAKSRRNPDIAAFINKFAPTNKDLAPGQDEPLTRPLIISDKKPAGRILSLSHLLDRDISIYLANRPQDVRKFKRFDPIFLYLPSKRLKQTVEEKMQSTLVPVTFGENDEPWLWQLPSR